MASAQVLEDEISGKWSRQSHELVKDGHIPEILGFPQE
jgi:hypothetical protein